MKRIFLFVIFLSFLGINARAQKQGEFSKTETGLQYKLYKNGGTIKPKIGDLVNTILVYTNDKDSVIFDSRNVNPVNVFELSPPTFKGGPEEAISMMAKGDSAVFLFSADSVFTKTFNVALPDNFKKGDKMKFLIKLLDIKSGEEKSNYLNQLKADAAKELEIKKNSEQPAINEFLSLNKLNITPLPSGLYYIEKEQGKGSQVKTGEKVKILYHCTLLNGTTVDTQLNEPVEFTTGQKKVIPGLEEGVLLMKRGTKATLIIPSKLAFGEKQIANITPYSTLIYDLEIKE